MVCVVADMEANVINSTVLYLSLVWKQMGCHIWGVATFECHVSDWVREKAAQIFIGREARNISPYDKVHVGNVETQDKCVYPAVYTVVLSI